MIEKGEKGSQSHPRLLGLFGFPVFHSLSPAMHNTALKALGLPWKYLPFTVHPRDLRKALDAVKVLDMPGVNLTIPLKEKGLDYMDKISESVRLTGAVNTVENREGILWGHNTDGDGYIRSLVDDHGLDIRGKNVLIIGAGGAARGIAFALVRKGVGSLNISNRALDFYRAKKLAGDIGRAFPATEHGLLPLSEGALARIFPSLDLLIHATSVGMGGKGTIPLPLEKLREICIVSDVVYVPRITGILSRARKIGLRIHSGIGMLLHQGALSLEIWTKKKAPLDIMRKTLEKALRS